MVTAECKSTGRNLAFGSTVAGIKLRKITKALIVGGDNASDALASVMLPRSAVDTT